MGATQRITGQQPFTVFHVRPGQPEEILVDTVMAMDVEDAKRIATKYGKRTVLHVRPLGKASGAAGDKGFEKNPHRSCLHKTETPPPAARFINGKFRPADFSDDEILFEAAAD